MVFIYINFSILKSTLIVNAVTIVDGIHVGACASPQLVT